MCVLPFTPGFAQLSPGAFVERVLVGALRAVAVVVGANFSFGYRGAGDPALLHELGDRHGFTVEAVALLHEVGAPCSSTYVRERLRAGDVRGAARALGRPHRVDSGRHTAVEVTPGGGLLVVAEGPVSVEFLDRVRRPHRAAAAS